MITEAYINKLIEEYAKSPAGKAEIKRKTGITYTDKDPSAMLTAYGEQMKNILYKHVSALIKSVTPEDIIVEKPYLDRDGLWRLEVSFREGSLRRDSLDLDDYPEGLDNIVLLFAKGYNARNYVYGWWMTSYGNHGDVRSRKSREGSDFLIQAVNEFNNGAGKGIARAELLGAYKECSES